jgi:hypothetical protein
MKHPLNTKRRSNNQGRKRQLGFVAVGLVGLGLFAIASRSEAAFREPPSMSREQVQSGLRSRQRAMEIRQELRRLRQQEGRRAAGGGPGRGGLPRLPRDPIPAPPPASLP